MATARIGLREVKALEPHSDIWDTELRGFVARRRSTSDVGFFVFYRSPVEFLPGTRKPVQRLRKLGKFPVLSPDEARREARRVLGIVASGIDPASEADAERANVMTGGELIDRYQAAVAAGRVRTQTGSPKKSTTGRTDISRIKNHIRPAIGGLKITAISSDQMRTIAETGGRRTFNFAAAMMQWAVDERLLKENVARAVPGKDRGKADQKFQRRGMLDDDTPISPEEYAKLGQHLDTAQSWPFALSAVRFLAVSGWRASEALTLTWDDLNLDQQVASLPDSKTGKSTRALGAVACDILRGLPRTSSPLCFPPESGKRIAGFTLSSIMRRAGLPPKSRQGGVSPHTMRHGFASIALNLGYSELVIGKLVGHVPRSMTGRYAKPSRDVLIKAANETSAHIAGLMTPDTAEKETPVHNLDAA